MDTQSQSAIRFLRSKAARDLLPLPIAMPDNDDPHFFDRADAHIRLSNEQTHDIGAGKVSASMLFAAARFNSWLTARGFNSAHEMKERREENIEYFVSEYRKMLEDNMDEYIDNFAGYMEIEQ